MILKLTRAKHLKEDELSILDDIDDGCTHRVKLSTNELLLEMDPKDNRNIKAINNVKMIYQLEKGCLILKGNLGCSFCQPMGGEFFVKKVSKDEMVDFNEVEGVVKDIGYNNSQPIWINDMRYELEQISHDDNFVFNMNQFDDFMDIFTFYKELSNELNNNTTYDIISISDGYYFVPIEVKDECVDRDEEVRNLEDMIIGYKMESYKYDLLPSDVKDRIRYVHDIKIEADDKAIKKIRKFTDNIYTSDFKVVDDRNSRDIKDFDMINISSDKGKLILTGEMYDDGKYRYLNLYDMGQKVKLDSIDLSLKLINQGASGAAIELLEYLIGDKPMPTNKREQAEIISKRKYISRLDESQKEAFLMATDGSPVSLIKGPPGTGKTYVINAIVQYITKELGEKVVISSQTHVAIDNVLDELMENYDLIIPNRITNRRNKYAGNEIDSTLYKTWARNIGRHSFNCENQDLANSILNDVKNFDGEHRFKYSEKCDLADYSVIGATTTTSAIAGKKGLDLLSGYKWLIIDEVSKCPITEVLRYLPYVEKIIMVGDDFQLAPLLEFNKEDVEHLSAYNEDKFEQLKSIYERSVFSDTMKKAIAAGRIVTLTVNYRSVKDVLNTYNVFYNGQLTNKREKVKPDKVKFTDKIKSFNESDVFFVEVKNGQEARQGTSRYNIEEIEATAEMLKQIMDNVLNLSKVTVSAIFPYAAQIEKFQKRYLALINECKKKFKSFEIDTVDAFQGRETDIVLVNTVVTTPRGNFLDDFRRINVSMSRSRDKLFVFGNSYALSKIEMTVNNGAKRKYFGEIIDYIRKHGQRIEYVNGGINYVTSSSKIKLI